MNINLHKNKKIFIDKKLDAADFLSCTLVVSGRLLLLVLLTRCLQHNKKRTWSSRQASRHRSLGNCSLGSHPIFNRHKWIVFLEDEIRGMTNPIRNAYTQIH